MPESSQTVDALFAEALTLPAAERSALLARACGDDAALRRRVEELLSAHEAAGDFMTAPAAPRADEIPSPGTTREQVSGERIGRYKLLERIGEGGWGTVYLAEQEEPVRRRVALKVIRLGMDTAAVIARFEAERQALAMMEHANIARVFDGGATESGRPYFVMELVRGVTITDYCDQQRLTTRQRLELFTQVCHAVQHAHQKGIIHRDLKPSNILVTLRDDQPAPKVIDFGIAKATEQRLTEKTLFTRLHHFVGTPAYMSPEQTGINGLDVDTRSDIYSLGVLLYELLVGHTPFDTKALLAAGFEEIQRTIREKEPPRPSHRLASLSPDELTTTAQRRRLESRNLVSELRGDLDWIVMKCLQKERTRRYETAGALSLDLARYLNHEPVLARPDSLAYRTGKFLRRHRLPVIVAAVVVIALVVGLVGTITPLAFAAVVAVSLLGGLIGTLTQAQRAQRQAAVAEAQRQLAENERMRAEAERRLAEAERRRADHAARRASEERDIALRELSRAEAIDDLMNFVLWDAAPSGKPFTAAELIERAERTISRDHAETVENRVEILVVLGRHYSSLNDVTKACEMLRQAYELSRNVSDRGVRAKAAAVFGDAIAMSGDVKRGEQMIQEALMEVGDDPRHVLSRAYCLDRGSHVAVIGGDAQTAVDRMEEAVRILRESKQSSTLRDLTMSIGLADAYRAAGRNLAAAASYEATLRRLADLGRDETIKAAILMNNWAVALAPLGRPLEVERLMRRSVAIRTADGTDQNIPPMVLANLAVTLQQLHRFDEAAEYAERAHRRAIERGYEVAVNFALAARASACRARSELDRAAEMLDELERRWRANMPANFQGFVRIANERAQLAAARGDAATALAEADRACALADACPERTEHLPTALRIRAEVKEHFQRLDEARTDAERAIGLWQETIGRDTPSCWVGRARLVVARVLAAQGNVGEARAAFAETFKHLEPTLGADHLQTREAARGLRES